MNSFSTVEKLLAKQSYPTIEKKPEHRLEAEVILLEYGVKKDSGFFKLYLCTRQKNHPHRIFIGLGVKKLTNCRNTVLSLLKNTKRRPSINTSRPSANKLA